MRTILGSIDTGAFVPVYKDYLNRLQRSKELSKFKFGDKYGSSPFLGVNLHTRCNPLNPRTISGNMTLI